MGIFKSASILPITRSVVSQGLENMFGDDPLKGFPSVKPKGGNDFDHLQEIIQPAKDMHSQMKGPEQAKAPLPKPARHAIHILDGFKKAIETGQAKQLYMDDATSLRYIQKIKEVLENGDFSS